MEANAASASIKGKFRSGITLFTHSTWSEVEVVIDYEYLSGAHGEEVIKEVWKFGHGQLCPSIR